MSANKRLVRVLVTLGFISGVAIPSSFNWGGAHALLQSGAGKDWPIYLGGPENLHYSSLTQVNRKNVKDLKIAWTFETGDAFPRSEMQCNPLVVNGVLYATTPMVNVIALNAASGKLLWRFDPNQGRKVLGTMRNRGITYWSDGKQERIFATVRQYLYSLDAKTGKPVVSFGAEGRIDLRENLRPGEKEMISMTTPGIIYKDLLIVGSITSETLPTPPGDIRAYEVTTGKLRWAFHTIPRPGEFGYETWPQGAWKYTGSANNWAGMALDKKRGLVFVPTGSAAYDFYGANRVGDNLFANCLIALKADTGERVWHFQAVRHDIWDRDFPSPPTLVTINHDGRLVDAVAQTTKSGHVYMFERETGKPLFPIEYRKYPPSDIEGEVAAEMQPLPVKPKPFARQQLTVDLLTQRTPEAHTAVLERFKKLRSAGQFIPGSHEGTVIFPGYDGAAEWGGSAFDPETGLLYVNSNEMAWILTMVEARPVSRRVNGKELYTKECASCHGADLSGAPPEFPSLRRTTDRYTESELTTLLFQGSGRMPSFARLGRDGIRAVLNYVIKGEEQELVAVGPSPMDMKYLSDGYKKFLDPDGYPAVQPPWGTLNAIDLKTGEYAWKIPLGEYPELAAKGMSNTGSENYGGPLVTAGGLIFIGATCYDKKFRAFDKKTGNLLWEATLPAAGNATPATYEVDGRQFVVIAAGGGKSKDPSGGSYVAFALPR
ncbi:MAG TPA: PQQ-binding-like beta-propeller repeat protein [Blastocatellia bacterium]